ncbi:MAG: response regulator [Lachnospiraceae bacterium]|nr:response regulator [Lachnospiraceae bacterium]
MEGINLSDHTKVEHGLIEYILSALDAPEENSSALRTPDGSRVLNDVNIQAAHEVKKFMDEMPGGFFIYRAEGQEELIYANKAMLHIFNCDTMAELRELTKNSFRGIVHPDDLEAVEESIRVQIAHSQHDLDYVEYRIIQKGGQIRWIEDYGHFVHSEYMGGIFYVFAGDATEKKQRQAAEKTAMLNEKRAREKQLQNQIEAYDKELKVINQEHLRRLEVIEGLSINYESILYVNLDADRILPYRLSSRTELQFGKKFEPRSFRWYVDNYIDTWVCPEDRESVRQATLPECIREKLSKNNTYYINYRVQKDGELQYLQLRLVNVSSENQISRVVLGYRRVDDELQYEMEQKKILEDALNHARLANIAKDTFLSNMSHDMRTPLNAITGYTALAQKHSYEPALVGEYLQKIETSSQQLLSLINDVLEISRLESGTIHNRESECHLPAFMEKLKLVLLPIANRKKLNFSVDLSGLEHGDIYCDSEKLERILLCLIGNAIKYTGNGGQVLLRVMEQKEAANNYGTYRFLVEDNGIGISPEFLQRIFDPFERVQNTTQSGIQGTGLGLTIAKNMVETMGGSIQVESTPGKGSCFTVIFDFRLLSQHLSPTSHMTQAVLQLVGSRKLLLVDDNEINVEIESELLEDLGFTVDTAANGRIALDMLVASPPHTYALILMDIQMPVMNGYEATRAIRGLETPSLSSIPIIALSSNAFEEDRQMSRESGMNAHIPKPVNIPELLDLMEKTIQLIPI